MLQRLFHLDERNTSVRIEITAGLTTFMTMAYIIVVNPSILHTIPGLYHARASLAAATCLAAAIPTIMMGLFTNTPYALAPGLGLSGVLAYTVCARNGVPWTTAMGIVVIEGLIIALLVVTRTQQAVVQAIPLDLKRAFAAGIGLYLTYLGLAQSQITRLRYSYGDIAKSTIHNPAVLLGVLALVVTTMLYVRKVRGSFLIGIAITTLVSLTADTTHLPITNQPFVLPHFGTLFYANVLDALKPGLWATILAFVMSDFFGAIGTVVGVGQRAGLVDANGDIPGLRNILLVNSFAAIWGGFCGTSSSSTYVESATGVAEGGRTGLTAVVVGILFLLAMFATPLVRIIPAQATAPALIIVGFLMLSTVTYIDWGNVETALPAFITIIGISTSYSIATGIGLGFIMYVIIMAVRGKLMKVHPILLVIAVLFLLSFLF